MTLVAAFSSSNGTGAGWRRRVLSVMDQGDRYGLMPASQEIVRNRGLSEPVTVREIAQLLPHGMINSQSLSQAK